MKQSIKNKWLKALRGDSPLGVYEQTQRTMEHEGRFCCLGVLRNETTGFGPSDIEKSFSNAELTELGLSFVTQENLIRLNDILENSFSEIADWIEENIKVTSAKKQSPTQSKD